MIRILFYPSVRNLKNLPRKPGIYYYTSLFRIRYVGLSKSLHKRWNRKDEREHKWRQKYLSDWFARLHYQECKIEELEALEALEIHRLKPSLNIRKERLRWNFRTVRAVIFEEAGWMVFIASILLLAWIKTR